MAVYSVKRCNLDDEQIIFDADHGLIRIYGRQASFSAPLHNADLQHGENSRQEGGVLSVRSAGFCGNVQLTVAEYVQAEHYLWVIKQLTEEVTLQ